MSGRDRRLEELRVRLEAMGLEIQAFSAALDGLLEWVRHCPMCGRELRRTDPMEIVKCPCGWVWNGP